MSHSVCHSVTPSVTPTVRHTVSHSRSQLPPTRPDPTRPGKYYSSPHKTLSLSVVHSSTSESEIVKYLTR